MRTRAILLAALVLIAGAGPAAAHIPELCYPLVAERTAANEAAADGFKALIDMVSDRMPMFMIDQAVLEASELLKDTALAELRNVECVVDAE